MFIEYTSHYAINRLDKNKTFPEYEIIHGGFKINIPQVKK